MSLKFGIYLVEQRVVSPEQFCGLIKIQQESVRSLAKLALERNMMTIRQVTDVLTAQETSGKAFQQIAIEQRMLSATDATTLIRAQEQSGVALRILLVECNVLTENQCRALYAHFERTVVIGSKASVAQQAPAQQAPAHQAQFKSPTKTNTGTGPRQPNFKRRPVIAENQNQATV